MPPRPPWAHIQPLASVVHQQIQVALLHPLKHTLPVSLICGQPIDPQTKLPAVTSIDLLEYAPELPGNP